MWYLLRVNLAPESGRVFTVNWFQIIFTIFFIILVLALALNFYFTYNKMKNLENRLTDLNKQLAIYNPQKLEYFKINKEIKELQKLSENKEENSINFAPVIKEMGFVVPDNVTFQMLNYNGENILITGKARTTSGVTGLMNNIYHSPFFTDLNLRNISQREEVQFQLEIYLSGRD